MWLETKYINMLAGTLPNLVRKGSGVWNFRCVFCGDSQKSKTKARGYLIQDRSTVYSTCHNCGVSHKFPKFLELVNPHLYSEYALEAFSDRKDIVQIKPIPQKDIPLKNLHQLPRISLLPLDHNAVEFLSNRLIPRQQWAKLYYADDFYKFCRNFFDDKYQSDFKEPRIIIPLINQHKKLIGFQGRAIVKTDYRYITALLSPTNPKIFGLNTTDFNQPSFAVEGPFDSMFIPNSIAVLGGAIDATLRSAEIPTGLITVVYDNEPRNKDVCRNILRAINNGYKVVIWPKGIDQKDINDMILANVAKGMSLEQASEHILSVLNSNIYKGLDAELAFRQWKRC